MITKTVYVTLDGKEFTNKYGARKYELDHFITKEEIEKNFWAKDDLEEYIQLDYLLIDGVFDVDEMYLGSFPILVAITTLLEKYHIITDGICGETGHYKWDNDKNLWRKVDC